MATNKTVTLEAKTKGFDEAEKEIQDVGKAAKVANDSVEGLNKTFEQVYGELQPLTTRMGEAEDRLYELAAAGDTTSREYQELLTKVGDYRKVQIQTDLAVDSAATTLGQKLGGALTGATGGFAAVQGVMGLVGGESEQLEKALLKVQSALAIQQGVQGIREAIPAFKQLGKTAMTALKGIKTGIAATGVGLLVVAVGAIVAYWEDITELLGVNNESLEDQLELEKKIADEKAKQKSEMEEIIRNNNTYIERQIEIVKTEEEIKDLAIDREKNEDAIFEKQLKINKLKQQNYFVERGSLDGLLSKQEQVALELEYQILLKEEQRLKDQKAFDEAKKAEEAAAERRKKKKDDLKEIARLEQEAIDQMVDDEIALQQTLDAIKRENEDRFRTEQENELLLVEEKYDALKASAFGNKEALEEIEIARLNERNDINLKYDTEAYDAKKALDDKAAADQKERDEKELSDAKMLQDAKFKMAQDGLALISNITQLFGQKNEKQAKKAFQIDKAAKIASATMSGIEGTINAYKTAQSSPITALLPVYPVIQAGLAAAFAATNIAAIGQQKFEGGGPGPDVSEGGGGGVQAPSFNVVGDSGVNQLAELQQQPAQAYVVSGEVTTAQALDRNRVQNATL